MFRTRLQLLPLLLALLVPAVRAAPAAIAADGFGRPVQLDRIDSSGDAQVAIAASADGPAVVWEDEDGLVLRSLDPGAGPEERLVETRGIRALAAGGAGGDAVVAWAERDLRTGRNRIAWRWRGETRELFETAQIPLLRVVAGGEAPELVVALPEAAGWAIALHDWEGGARRLAPREETVAGIDALRVGDRVHVAWLEGANEVVLGEVQRDWTAYVARFPDGGEAFAPEALGPAVRIGTSEAVRLAAVEGGVHAMWPGPDERLRTTGPGAPRDDLGPGTPLGRLGGAWTWATEDAVVRLAEGDAEPRTVLRLPSAPEWVEGSDAGGATALAWSTGRYMGGLEVWGVVDGVAYAPGPVERFASFMGWDPWRPWEAAAGHLLLTALVAVVLAAALTPLWWAATALLGRHSAEPGLAALEGALVAVVSILLLAGLFAWRATLDPATLRSLLGGPLLLGTATALGLAAGWLVGRRLDVEAGFGRLASAWVAGGAMLAALAFGTLQAWQDAFGGLL